MKKNKNNLLIITASLLNSSYLIDTISSVQKYAPFAQHCIIYPAKNKKKIKDLKEKFPNIIFIAETKTTNGYYQAINYVSLKYKTQFKFFSYLNDDDYLLPDFYNYFQWLLKQEIDVSYAKQSILINNKFFYTHPVTPFNNLNLYLFKRKIFNLYHPSMIFSSKIFNRYKYSSKLKICADCDLILKLINSNHIFKFYKNNVSVFRKSKDQLSANKEEAKIELSSLNFYVSPFNFLYKIINFILNPISYIKRCWYYFNYVNKDFKI